METLTLAIVIAGLFTVGFVLGGIFGAGVYHFAKKQVEKGAKAISDAANSSNPSPLPASARRVGFRREV